MIKVEKIETFGFEAAIRGMRNPMNSWDKSDSYDAVDCNRCGLIEEKGCCTKDDRPGRCDKFLCVAVGNNDLDLMQRLFKAGTEHRKYLRMIHVQMDIVAPLYWWKEFDTYKVGTVSNSCSTMHKIHSKEFTMDDFSHEHLFYFDMTKDEHDATIPMSVLDKTIKCLNVARQKFIETKDKHYWWQMIELLPSSYNQRRTIDMNYETVFNIIKQRTNHKLDEWNDFIKVLEELPYVKEIME